MGTEKKFKTKAVFFLILAAIMTMLQLPQQVCATEQKDTIVVGTNAEYAPFEYLDSNGNLTGFDIDLMNAIAKEENVNIKWVDLPFDSLLGSIEAGDIEAIAASIAPTKERAQSVDFSDVYYTGSQSIVYRTGDEYTDFSELTGKTIAVLEGSQSDLIASGENEDYGIVSGATVKRFKNASSAIMELKNKGADVVIIDTIMAEIYCRQTDGIKSIPVEGTEEDTVFCVQKGNSNCAQLLNNGLKKVKENGTYDELYAKYFSGEENDNVQITETQDKNVGIFGTLKFIFVDENRWQYYVNGLGTTLLVSLLSVFVGLLLGLIVAIIRINADRKGKKTIGSLIAAFYVDVIRGTPSVLQLMIVYFAVFHSRLGYVAAVVSFGINSGAYVSEVIRGGIQAVDRGQTEAGRSLGLCYKDTMRYIVIPQAVKNILPALCNEFVAIVKETSLASTFFIGELMTQFKTINGLTFRVLEPLTIVGIIYFGVTFIMSKLIALLERRMNASER